MPITGITWDEFAEWLNALPYAAQRGDISKKMLKSAQVRDYNCIADFVYDLAYEERMARGQIPDTQDNIYLHDIMKEIYESGYKFWDCEQPKVLLSFIDPYNGHWQKRLSDFKGGQANTWGVIYRKYNENKEAGTLLGPKPNLPIPFKR